MSHIIIVNKNVSTYGATTFYFEFQEEVNKWGWFKGLLGNNIFNTFTPNRATYLPFPFSRYTLTKKKKPWTEHEQHDLINVDALGLSWWAITTQISLFLKQQKFWYKKESVVHLSYFRGHLRVGMLLQNFLNLPKKIYLYIISMTIYDYDRKCKVNKLGWLNITASPTSIKRLRLLWPKEGPVVGYQGLAYLGSHGISNDGEEK